jgi:alkaline phosphatase D
MARDPLADSVILWTRLVPGGEDLADFFVLDTRQYRTDQVCAEPFDFGPVCEDAHDPANTLLGADQKAWLTDGLDSASGRWTFIAQQVPFAPVPFEFGGRLIGQLDTWEGYTAERDELTAVMADTSNPVVLTGDLHAAVVADVATEYGEDGAPGEVVATEFVATSISSIFGDEFGQAYEVGADKLGWSVTPTPPSGATRSSGSPRRS